MNKRSILWMFFGFVGVIFVAWSVGYLMSGSGSPTGNVTGQSASGSPYRGWLADPVIDAPDFELVNQHGEAFRLSDYKGKAVVLFFGYTTCPDVCPATLAQLRDAKEDLGKLADRVEFVFITVDPERDDTEKMGRYVSIFDDEFAGLTGSREALESVWKDYGIYVERVDDAENPGQYWVNHTSFSYVIDPAGKLQLVHPFGANTEDIVYDLRQILS